jgi:hypothetical protein
MTDTPKILEAWFTLMAEAMRGTGEAQEAFKVLSRMSGNSPQSMSDWMAKFMPGVAAATPETQPELLESWLEEWQRVMGVVPRARYLALLEKYDILQQHFEKAEQTIKTLQALVNNKGTQEVEAKKVLDMWGTMLEDTLKMQTEWMQNWTEERKEGGPATDEPAVDDEPPTPPKP